MNDAVVGVDNLRLTRDAEEMRLEPKPDGRAGVSADVAGMPAHFHQWVFADDENYLFSH